MRKSNLRQKSRIALAIGFTVLLTLASLQAVARECNCKPLTSEADPPKDSPLGLLQAGDYTALDRRLSLAQAGYRSGQLIDIQVFDEFRHLYNTLPKWRSKYDEWVTAKPDSYVARLARANYLRMAAAVARGDQSAYKTTSAQFASMESLDAAAAKDYEDSLKLDPKPILSYDGMLDMSRHAGQQQREILEKALRVDPRSFLLRRDYMSVLETRWGHSTEEMQAFLTASKAAKITSTQEHILEAMVMEDRAFVVESNGDDKTATKFYRQAVDLVDDLSEAIPGWYPNLLESAAYASMQIEDFAGAIPLLRKSVDAYPYSAIVYFNLATSLEHTGQIAESNVMWKKAADLGDPDALNSYGERLWYGSQGVSKDQAAAIRYFEKAVGAGSVRARGNLRMANRTLYPLQMGGAQSSALSSPPN